MITSHNQIPPDERQIGRVPVRNLWLLMLYASDLARISREVFARFDNDIDDLPDLIARLLVDCVNRRLRNNLTRDYCPREEALTRVRGRIDLLATESRQLLSRGEVFCRFEELTVDTPRNRLVRAALEVLARLVRSNDMVRQCRALATMLGRAGVTGLCPSRTELASDQFGRNDSADRVMVVLARLAFDMALPTEEAGSAALVSPDREDAWVRRLFEKAVLGFAQVELGPRGWHVEGGIPLMWQYTPETDGIRDILPNMVTDIVIQDSHRNHCMVIDTKFTSILGTGRFGNASLKSNYLYQIYAYLRSQEGRGICWDTATGLLLHPAIGSSVYEQMILQNHRITFATVNLGGQATAIRSELRRILDANLQT